VEPVQKEYHKNSTVGKGTIDPGPSVVKGDARLGGGGLFKRKKRRKKKNNESGNRAFRQKGGNGKNVIKKREWEEQPQL